MALMLGQCMYVGRIDKTKTSLRKHVVYDESKEKLVVEKTLCDFGMENY